MILRPHSIRFIMMATMSSQLFGGSTRISSGGRSMSALICAGNGLSPARRLFSCLTVIRDTGAEVTIEQKAQGLEEIEVYKTWFRDNIMTADEVTASDAVLILPCGTSAPKYRDDQNVLVTWPILKARVAELTSTSKCSWSGFSV